MAYENLSREELISALETLTGVDQFAAGAATDPNGGGASVVPNIGSFLDKRPARFNPDASRNPEDFLDTRPAAFNPDASRNITDYIDPMVSGGAPAYYRDQPEATPFYDQQFPYFGFDQTKQGVGADFTTDPNFARAMRESRSPTGFDYSSMPAGEEVIDMATGLRPVDDASVVRPIGETIDRVMRQPEQVLEPVGGVMDPPSEQDLMFHEVQKAIRRGEEPEAPQWMIDMVRAVPEEDWASALSGGDKDLQAFHQKHGFPPAVGG